MARKRKSDGIDSRYPQEETLRHQEVFEIYYAMGDARSLRVLAEIVGVTAPTVEGWSSAFKWQERVALRDQELIRRIQEDYKDEVIKYRCFYIDMVKGMIKDCLEFDEQGRPTCKIKANSVSDLEKLVNLHMKLMGDSGGPLSDDDTPSGGKGPLVNIVLPQQVEMGQWQDMVKGPGAGQTLTIKGP